MRVPSLLRNWTRYTGHLLSSGASDALIQTTFERALSAIPNSYKLWRLYLEWANGKEALSLALHDRASKELPRFPKIWLGFAEATVRHLKPDIGLMVLDNSLRSLPITQHERIWDFYRVHFCEMLKNMKRQVEIIDIFKRWSQLHPHLVNLDYAQRMIHFECYDDAAHILLKLSESGDQKAIGLLLEMLSTHPEIDFDDADDIIRSAIESAGPRAGPLWNILATRAVQRGHLRAAQCTFEEAIERVKSLEDFCIVFEAFSMFLESICARLIDATEEVDEDRAAFYLFKLEQLLVKRQFYLTNVLVRLEPHNVSFWEQRLQLFNEGFESIKEFERATRLISPRQTNQFHRIWISFARMYIANNQWETGMEILEHAACLKVRLQPDDHAALLVEWSEMVLKEKGDLGEALEVLKRGCLPQSPSLHSPVLWNRLVDLQEAVAMQNLKDIAVIDAVIQTYKRMIDLKVASVQNFCNYADFVIEATRDYDAAFAVYEKGIASFGWPLCFELWNIYLPKAIEVWGKRPLGVERVRELFDHALHGCPDQYATRTVILYCDFEERFGSVRNVLRILDSGVSRPLLPKADLEALYKLYIVKSREFAGVSELRQVYERAMKALASEFQTVTSFAIDWAKLEASLGEMVRARSLFVHVAEQSPEDDRIWTAWEEIERHFGDQYSYRDMLRLKKAINERHARRHGSLMSSFVPASSK